MNFDCGDQDSPTKGWTDWPPPSPAQVRPFSLTVAVPVWAHDKLTTTVVSYFSSLNSRSKLFPKASGMSSSASARHWPDCSHRGRQDSWGTPLGGDETKPTRYFFAWRWQKRVWCQVRGTCVVLYKIWKPHQQHPVTIHSDEHTPQQAYSYHVLQRRTQHGDQRLPELFVRSAVKSDRLKFRGSWPRDPKDLFTSAGEGEHLASTHTLCAWFFTMLCTYMKPTVNSATIVSPALVSSVGRSEKLKFRGIAPKCSRDSLVPGPSLSAALMGRVGGVGSFEEGNGVSSDIEVTIPIAPMSDTPKGNPPLPGAGDIEPRDMSLFPDDKLPEPEDCKTGDNPMDISTIPLQMQWGVISRACCMARQPMHVYSPLVTLHRLIGHFMQRGIQQNLTEMEKIARFEIYSGPGLPCGEGNASCMLAAPFTRGGLWGIDMGAIWWWPEGTATACWCATGYPIGAWCTAIVKGLDSAKSSDLSISPNTSFFSQTRQRVTNILKLHTMEGTDHSTYFLNPFSNTSCEMIAYLAAGACHSAQQALQ